MKVIGKPEVREFTVKTRTSAMETAEDTRLRRLADRDEREERRAEAARIAEEAATRRSTRAAGSILERVEKAKERLVNVPVGAALTIIGAMSAIEREAYLIAEETGPRGAKSPVLGMFPGVRNATREEFEAAVSDLQVEASAPEPEPEKRAPKKRAEKTAE